MARASSSACAIGAKVAKASIPTAQRRLAAIAAWRHPLPKGFHAFGCFLADHRDGNDQPRPCHRACARAPPPGGWLLVRTYIPHQRSPPDGKPLKLYKEMCSPCWPNNFEREFITGGQRVRITGIDPRRPKYPLPVERIPDRRSFKFTADNVAMLLKTRVKFDVHQSFFNLAKIPASSRQGHLARSGASQLTRYCPRPNRL